MSLKEKLKNYRERQKRKSTFAKVTDILFVVFIVLLLIPASRREIRTFVTRLSMMQPSVKEKATYEQLEDQDYDWQLETFNGDRFTLGDISGNVIFLNFWATWCPPCRAEMPAIQQLYNQFENEVVFILVSNENRNIIQNYFVEEGYELPVYFTLSEIPEELQSSTIPATYIISKSGEIILDKKGAAKWDGENIKQLLYKLVSE